MRTILVFCAHSDDEAIGMAGTIAKYVSEKVKVIKVVFSSGEKSSPHLREDYVKKERSKETDKACNFIGICDNINLGLKDAMLKTEINKSFVEKRVKELIMLNRPEKIFIPSAKDPHPDHRAVNRSVMGVVNSMKKHYSVYAYEVWNIIDETHPQIYVDISEFMNKKMEYIRMFKSQWVYMFTLYFPAWIRAFYYGRKNNSKYAERFYKLK
ncbi:PIG-L family deacetylase [Candidatus Woesearchaeota archaeon]|nr:PIG-L family deacetylase [Candidatus Woesearchaeota archaeon]